jgi:hypothetical protein
MKIQLEKKTWWWKKIDNHGKLCPLGKTRKKEATVESRKQLRWEKIEKKKNRIVGGKKSE